jgi:hypothetical protein
MAKTRTPGHFSGHPCEKSAKSRTPGVRLSQK